MCQVTTPMLEGSRIVLRELRESDTATRRDLGQHPEIARLRGRTVSTARSWTDAEARAWYQANLDQENPYYWIIQHGRRMIGNAQLYRLNDEERRARYAISILDPALLGRGFGSEATGLVLGHAFTALGLHRVDLRVLAFNERAIACYGKCGFVIEGRERETALIDGTWYDDVMMSILEHEYPAKRG